MIMRGLANFQGKLVCNSPKHLTEGRQHSALAVLAVAEVPKLLSAMNYVHLHQIQTKLLKGNVYSKATLTLSGVLEECS